MPSSIRRRVLARNTPGRFRAGMAVLTATAGLAGAVAPAASAAMPLLQEGSSGSSVAQVQRDLGLNGTGYFGPVTRRYVVAFQSRNGLLVDGIVGPQTWGALSGASQATTSYNSASSGSTGSSTGYGSTYNGSTYGSTGSTESTGSTGSTTPSYQSSSGYSGGYSIPSSIVQCESGGNWSAVNPSSGAGGAYQILPSTWAAYGGQGLPQNASPAEQSRIASAIWAHQGSSAWSC